MLVCCAEFIWKHASRLTNSFPLISLFVLQAPCSAAWCAAVWCGAVASLPSLRSPVSSIGPSPDSSQRICLRWSASWESANEWQSDKQTISGDAYPDSPPLAITRRERRTPSEEQALCKVMGEHIFATCRGNQLRPYPGTRDHSLPSLSRWGNGNLEGTQAESQAIMWHCLLSV